MFAGTFYAASQQIAVDRLTVKTAIALAGLELLNLCYACWLAYARFYRWQIAVRRRLGFLAGAIAGAVFYLITFLA